MKKRPIAEVREEIRDLDWGIQHGMVRGDGICFVHPVVIMIPEAKIRLAELKSAYPNWEKVPGTK